MSQQSKLTRSNRFTLSACVMAIATAVMAATPMWANADESPTHEPHDAKSMPSDHHSKMGGMKHMEGMSMTGDTDYDFAANMRMHHQMAVDMSEAQIKNGKNPEMLKMAKDIIAAQKKEIAMLDQWMKAHGKPMTKAMPKSK